MFLLKTAEMALPTWAGPTSPGRAAALMQPGLQRKDAAASQSLAVQCHSLGLATAATLGKLCCGCSGVTGEGGESPAQQAEGTGGDRVSRDTAELRTTTVLCCKGGKLQDDSHGSSGWRLPQEGSLQTSGSPSQMT